MADERKRAFSPYLRALADLMGLRDWTVGIDDDPPDPKHLAECDARYGRKIAWLRLSEAFLDSAPDRQRSTVVHELIHCHTAHLEHLTHGETTEPGYKAFCLALEYAVDGIAEEWAKRLPLPDDVRPAKEARPMAKKPPMPKAPKKPKTSSKGSKKGKSC